MLIGDKIRLLRRNKGITQTQLAEALSVSPQSVSKWEHHLSAPDITLLPAVARYFGVTMDELFGYRLDALSRKERFIRFMADNGMLRFGEFTLFSKYGIDSAHCVDWDIENAAFASHDITLITDAFTSGATLCAALEQIRAKIDKLPVDIVVCVDRMERTADSPLSARYAVENRYGVRIHPIVTADDIMRAMDNGVISAGEHTGKMKDYLNRYRGCDR